MLTILDRYILKKFLSTFLFTVFIFTLIAVVIDFSDKISDFVEEDCTWSEVFFDYYVNWIPYIISQLVPLYVLIAVIFFTSRMAYDSEIISILNAGVSFRRMMMPYLVGSVLITGFHLFAYHYLVPIGNKSRLDFEHAYIKKNSDKGKTDNIHMFISPDEKTFIRRYKKKDTLALDLRLEQFKNNEMVKLVKAKKARWMGKPNRWQLSDYEIRTFNGRKESILTGYGEKMDTTINIYPQDFVRYANQKEMMTSTELQGFIDMERARGLGNTKVFEIEVHKRTSEPIASIILTLIGMAVAARKVRGGMGLHLAIGIATGAIFIFLSKFSKTFATNEDLPALIGVWIPNIIFFVIAMILISKAQK